MSKSIKTLPLILALMVSGFSVQAFCGFFVAKAGSKLFNNTSSVILVRDGQKSTITMSNDYQGNVSDFAMVVPVPVILGEDDIKTVDGSLFERIDDYSAPRLAEYYDDSPCPQEILYFYDSSVAYSFDAIGNTATITNQSANYLVVVEAEYQIDEYDIKILSASESNGLKRYLIDNGYSIPENAEEVLNPYINNGMKFFVAKVNLAELNKTGSNELSPIQIKFESSKFMLPIRLGMANSQGTQDLLIYTFTKDGRVESTNYRTLEMPTDNEIPTFLKNETLFGYFYKDVFQTNYRRTGRNDVYLEYFWDISGTQPTKCDPCVAPPISREDLLLAGVDWITGSGMYYDGDVFITRMHTRYDRARFPQDLQFHETPNRDPFQCRYVLRHPYTGTMECDEADAYLQQVAERRVKEMEELKALTRWNTDMWKDYTAEYAQYLPENTGDLNLPSDKPYDEAGMGLSLSAKSWMWVLTGIATFLLVISIGKRIRSAKS